MKISKTLKRLRAENGLTQEQLAEKLFISRQSVSSWENDRTQPDLEMLGKLSETFGVSLEELIYGKKHNTALETEKPDHTAALIIIFSVLGSLLAATGLILIFITFWEKMPVLSKAALSFLPVLAGQASALFVLSKKRDKLPWCEGAGILWTAGLGASFSMIYNIFDISIHWYTVLISLCFLIFPVMIILGCVSPLAVYYVCTLTWLVNAAGDDFNTYALGALSILLVAAGCVFSTCKLKKESASLRSIFSQWLSVAAVVALTVLLCNDFNSIIICCVLIGSCLLFISMRNSELLLPYRVPGILLINTALVIGSNFYDTFAAKNAVIYTLTAVLCGCNLFFAIRSGKYMKDKFFAAYIFVSLGAIAVFALTSFLLPSDVSYENHRDMLMHSVEIITILANVLLMISGARARKLIPINAGFITIAAICFLFLSLSPLSLLIKGLVLLIFGTVLLAINLKLSSAEKKEKTKTIPEEGNTYE